MTVFSLTTGDGTHSVADSWPKTRAKPARGRTGLRSARLRLLEQSEVVGLTRSCIELAGCAWRAVGGDLRPLAVVWIFGDEGEPAFRSVGDATAFLATQQRGSIPESSAASSDKGTNPLRAAYRPLCPPQVRASTRRSSCCDP